jgi:septum formation protein
VTHRLVLASASPARLRTLRAAGIEPEVVVSGVDESTVDSESPELLSRTLARLKAETVAARLRQRGTAEHALVLGCDTVLAFDGRVLGKPADVGEAERRWRAMRGRDGVAHTGHCLVDLNGSGSVDGSARTTVHFADLTDAEIAAYVGTGEPLRTAGGFAIDGLGGPFVERVDGDPGTVSGVSLPLLRHLLHALGVEITSLWRDLGGSLSS